jgi:hypothetical protein
LQRTTASLESNSRWCCCCINKYTTIYLKASGFDSIEMLENS